MSIGFLVPGILVALLSGLIALLAGYGFWAISGFYILGGSLSMMIMICASLCYRMASQSKFVTPQGEALEA